MSNYRITKRNNKGLAGIMSLVLPGLGQVYTGRWIWAVFFFIFTPGFWLGTGGMLGWVFHIWAAYQAYNSCK